MSWAWACGTCWGEVHTGFWWQNLMEMDHLEDRIIDEKEVLKLILNWLGEYGLD